MKTCKVDNCDNDIFHKKGKFPFYCRRHYLQVCRHGKILKRTRYDKNEYIDCGNYCEIVLYKGLGEQKECGRTSIDKDDYEKIKDYKWYLNGDGYATTRIKEKILFLHHVIKPRHEVLDTDHKDNDTLNNRKNNLRYATRSQNNMNKKVKGYHWYAVGKEWQVEIMVGRKRIYLGRFKKEEDAKEARKQAEIKYFKEFRYNN